MHGRDFLIILILGLGFGACSDEPILSLDGDSVSLKDSEDSDVDDPDSSPNPCMGKAQLTPCDDGNICTENDRCFDEACVGAQRTCDDDNICTKDRCELPGGCVHEFVAKTCDDGNFCTSVDTCVDGVCKGNPVSDAVCDDGDVCTTHDVCTAGVCFGLPQTCNDLNPCTQDFCDVEHPDADDFFCVHEMLAGLCDDLNECTTDDTCVRGGCQGKIQEGLGCSDGSLCTDDGKCQADGSCKGSGKICNDDNSCTLDTCQPDGGCLFTPEPGEFCDDGSKCTVKDTCNGEGACVGETKCFPKTACEEVICQPESGSCVASPLQCVDDNVCTKDDCNNSTGCVFPPVAGDCTDDNKCTQNDSCENGACVGTETLCDDSGDAFCSQNLCQPLTGQCAMTDVNGKECYDGDPCTDDDTCSVGNCVGVPKNCTDGDPCTEDWCVQGTGACDHEVLVDGCEDLAFERANAYRTMMSLPLFKNNEYIKNAAEAHCKYYVANYFEVYKEGGLSPHNESPGYEGFTGEGFGTRMTTAGFTNDMGWPMFEVMHFIFNEEKSVDEWMASLYHRIPFVVPLAESMGYGAATKVSTASCDTIDFAGTNNGKKAYDDMIIPFPINGMQAVPVHWGGNESPQPPLPPGESYPSGPIMTVTFGAQNAWPGVALKDSVIMDPDGNTIDHVANDPQTDGDLCCGVVTLYPVAPLEPFTTYTVSLDYSKNGMPGSYEWSFTTGDGSSTHYL